MSSVQVNQRLLNWHHSCKPWLFTNNYPLGRTINQQCVSSCKHVVWDLPMCFAWWLKHEKNRIQACSPTFIAVTAWWEILNPAELQRTISRFQTPCSRSLQMMSAGCTVTNRKPSSNFYSQRHQPLKNLGNSVGLAVKRNLCW